MRDYQESLTTGRTDRRWTKWSLCAALLRMQHKNVNPLSYQDRGPTANQSGDKIIKQTCKVIAYQKYIKTSDTVGNTLDGLIFVRYQFSRFSWRVRSTNFRAKEIAIFCMNYEGKYYNHEFLTPRMFDFSSIQKNSGSIRRNACVACEKLHWECDRRTDRRKDRRRTKLSLCVAMLRCTHQNKATHSMLCPLGSELMSKDWRSPD